ncbi:MAG: YciI family protein [Saprospiraceae bacterium]
MKEYLLLFRGGDAESMQESAQEWQAHMQKWMHWMGGLQEKGQLVGAQPLDRGGRQVTGSKKVVTDGPFMEGKEMVGGYLMCRAENYDAAIEISKGCPILEFDDGIVELREIKELKM